MLTAGSGAPLVYIHGAGGLFWDPFLDALATTHRVIAPEHPGAGQSIGLEHVHDVWDLVLYYNELLDALGVAKADVVGHSFGGMVAAELACNNPDRVGRLVLIASMGLWLDDYPIPDISGMPPAQLPGLIFADPTGPLATSMPSPDPNDPDALLMAVNSLASFLQFMWPLPDKGLRKRLYRLKAPTLLVWGAEDRLVDPAYGAAFANLIRGSRLESVPAAGHVPQLEAFEQVSVLVGSFLATPIRKGYEQLVGEANARIRTLSLEEAQAKLGEDGVLFVDVRDARELDLEGMIPDAYSAPRGMLEFWVDPESPYARKPLIEARELVLYCAASWRSALAAAALQDMGMDNVMHIDGGFAAWKQAGAPVVPRPAKKS